MKPNINASLDELRGQSSRGIAHGSSPRSAGNVMPGANMRPAAPSRGGATGGTGANPSRTGAPAQAAGSYQPIKGSPGPDAPVTPTAASVRAHALAIGGLKHAVTVGHLHPTHAKQMEAKSRAHIAQYRNSQKNAAPKTTRFGALGGSGAGGMNAGGSMPGTPSLPGSPERDW